MTHLDFTILALLSQSPSTGYEIRRAFETTALGNYSSSPGSIYPALKKLQKQGMAIQDDSASGRKLFSITKKGIDSLKDWLTAPIESSDIEKKLEIIMLRFAFMEEFVTRQEAVQFLESFRDQVKRYLINLREFQKKSKVKSLHGRLAFEHGIVSYQATLDWIQTTLKKMEST